MSNALDLSACSIFAALSPQEAANVAAACEVRNFGSGERVFEEGEPGKSLFVVVEGMAALTRRSPSGATQQVGRCRAGELLGEMALLDAAPRSATATAMAPMVCLEMRRTTFEHLLTSASSGASKVLHQISLLLSTRLRAVIDRIEEELILEEEDNVVLKADSPFGAAPGQGVAGHAGLAHTLTARPVVGADDAGRHSNLWRVLWGVNR